MNVLVHIGYPKTGSTFMQEHLFPAVPNSILLDQEEIKDLFLRIGSLHFDSDSARTCLERRFNAAPEGTIWAILSDEELSGNIHNGGGGGYVAKEVADRLYATMPGAKVLILVRNQFSMIDSAYRQYIKHGGTDSVHRFIFGGGRWAGNNHRFPGFSLEHLEYDRLVAYYMETFGRDNVFVRPYEQMREHNQPFWNAVFADIGLGSAPDAQSIPQKGANPSYSCLSVSLARITNRFSADDPINRRAIVHIPFWIQVTRSCYRWLDRQAIVRRMNRNHTYIRGLIRERIGQHYPASNQRLAEITGLDLRAYEYPMPAKSD